MKGMLTTGEFAKYCGTTRKTLYHYERIGLLRPTMVGDNEYRYYSAIDCFRFSMVRALADSGLSLEQVAETLQKEDPQAVEADIEAAQAMVNRQIAHLEQQSRLLRELRDEMSYSASRIPNVPRLVERPGRCFPVLLRMEKTQKQLDSIGGFPEALVRLKKLAERDPVVLIASMGNSADLRQFLEGSVRDSSGIVYDMLFSAPLQMADGFDKADQDSHAKPAGVYVEYFYSGPWDQILRAYESALAFAVHNHLRPVDRFYEIPDSGLFDVNYQTHVRTTVTVRVEE